MSLRALNNSERIQTRRFGGFCPYWTLLDGQVVIADTAKEIILAIPESKRVIDPVAILGLLQFSYMLGNRTLVQGVQRMPWRATLTGDGVLERQPPLPHFERSVSSDEAARHLYEVLTEELYGVAQYHSRVLLLLSGGLDSRVVAGIFKRLEHQLSVEIECVTWGLAQSRDVAYARRIASWYDWRFTHIPYDADLTWENLQRGAIWGGSEVAGIHLHGMDWFRRCGPDDLVVAASFGDSIGRAEFSSRHMTSLGLALLQDRWGLLRPTQVGRWLGLAEEDRATVWDGAEDAPHWVRNELDMQENYMRRLICHAMDYIRQFCTLHQAFTSDKVVSYMWSLSPGCRTDEIYYELLKRLDSRLYSLPWARTGIAPDGTKENDESLAKNYHSVDRWLRYELRSQVEPLVLSDGLLELGLFHGPAIRRLWDWWLKEPDDRLWSWELIAILCSIELSHRRFLLRPCCAPDNWQDTLLDVGTRGMRRVRRTVRKVLEP